MTYITQLTEIESGVLKPSSKQLSGTKVAIDTNTLEVTDDKIGLKAGYATENYVLGRIAQAQLDGTVDLTPYALTDYVDDAIDPLVKSVIKDATPRTKTNIAEITTVSGNVSVYVPETTYTTKTTTQGEVLVFNSLPLYSLQNGTYVLTEPTIWLEVQGYLIPAYSPSSLGIDED